MRVGVQAGCVHCITGSSSTLSAWRVVHLHAVLRSAYDHDHVHMLSAALPQVIAESGSPTGSEARPYYDFLETCLRHKAEMVIFEAARAICEMRDVSSRYDSNGVAGYLIWGRVQPSVAHTG